MILKLSILKKKFYPVFFLGLIIWTTLWVQFKVNTHLHSDIHIYLDAGYRALNNQNPYQPFEIGSSFIYPPTALLLFSPLGKVKYPFETWTAINIVSFLLAIIFTFKASGIQIANSEWKIIAVGALFYAPFWEQVTIGQVNSLALLGITAFILGVTDQRFNWLGDFGLAVAISIKISPIILFAYPLLCGDWQRLFRISLSLLILIMLSILFFGIPPWLDFLKIMPEIAKGYPGMNNEIVDTLIKWMTGSSTPAWSKLAFSIFALVSWIAAILLTRNKTNKATLLSFGVVVMTISSILIWYHHLVFLLAPIIHLLLFVNKDVRMGRVILFLTLSGTILINSNRIFEYWLIIPALAAISGYLIIYLTTALSLADTSGQN